MESIVEIKPIEPLTLEEIAALEVQTTGGGLFRALTVQRALATIRDRERQRDALQDRLQLQLPGGFTVESVTQLIEAIDAELRRIAEADHA